LLVELDVEVQELLVVHDSSPCECSGSWRSTSIE
jgi:hypothetical protein